MDWQINFTQSALDTLRNISDRRIQRVILELAQALSEEPDRKGAPLRDELSGYRSIRAAGQRYRIIVTVQTCGDLRAIRPMLVEGQPSTEFALQADPVPSNVNSYESFTELTRTCGA